MESLVKESSSGTLQEPWNPDIVAYVGREIYENMNCMQAWKVIPKNAIISTLDAIRNRILNFVFEIEAESPDAGEAPVNSNPVPQEKVNQIFNTYITGNVQNVAAGSTNVKQKAELIEASEQVFTDLLNALLQSTEDHQVISEVTAVVEEMRDSQGTANFTEHYQRFMSVLADHMQVLGPAVAPFLPALAALVS